MSFKVGQTINTAHGIATILGFERFDKNGRQAKYSDIYLGHERAICKLDAGHTWCFEGNYAIYTRELKELN